ncbi:helix-turn-helix domain-containing protein [Nostoc sp.]
MSSIQKAFKVTLILTHNQEVLINKTIGSTTRVV